MILSCICIVLLVGVDQFIKYWAVHTLQPQGSIPFIKIGGKEVLNLTYLENQGAAFSSFSGMRWFLIAVTVRHKAPDFFCGEGEYRSEQ